MDELIDCIEPRVYFTILYVYQAFQTLCHYRKKTKYFTIDEIYDSIKIYGLECPYIGTFTKQHLFKMLFWMNRFNFIQIMDGKYGCFKTHVNRGIIT